MSPERDGEKNSRFIRTKVGREFNFDIAEDRSQVTSKTLKKAQK